MAKALNLNDLISLSEYDHAKVKKNVVATINSLEFNGAILPLFL